MKNHSKLGNSKGRLAYRTPAGFRYRKYIEISRLKGGDRRSAKKSAPNQPMLN